MKKILFFLAFTALLFGCNDDDSDSKNLDPRLVITMIDAPADYDKILIDIKDVSISFAENPDEWISLGAVPSEPFDLLQYVGGIEIVLADSKTTIGQLKHIKLTFGENNKLVIGEKSYNLEFSSEEASSVTLQVDKTILENFIYKIQLDFDAAKSIIEGENETYSLTPVVRPIFETKSGAILGVVKNSPKAFISITNGTLTFNSYANQNGRFIMPGIPEGTYTVTIIPKETEKFEVHTEETKIELGDVTNLGDINLKTKVQ